MKSHWSLSDTKQSGAVLVVALVMLLLLTIIGLTSIRGTALQENMAGNLRDASLSLQAAEAALRSGEKIILDKFIDNSFHDLEINDIEDVYVGFEGVSAPPAYRIILLAKLRTSTEAGVPIDDEGALVRVEGTGYGQTTRLNDSLTTQTQLRSTFLVEQ